MSTFITSYT